MELKHTPGTWHVEWAMAQGGDAHHVCIVMQMAELSIVATVHFHDDAVGETEANARLIAAAPQMREALLLWQEFCRMPPSFAASDAFGKAKAATNATIAAATGE